MGLLQIFPVQTKRKVFMPSNKDDKCVPKARKVNGEL